MHAPWQRVVLELTLLLVVSAVAAPPSATTSASPSTTAPSSSPTTPSPAVSEAVALEEAAFAAVDEEQWCVAMHLFVKADQAAPALPLVENAAHAAEYAGDLERAAELLATLVERESNAAKKKARKGAAWKFKVRSKGKTSTTCPALEVLRPPPPPEPEPEPQAEPDPQTPPPSPLLPPTLGPVVGGVGVVTLIAGAAVMAVGVLPYVDHQNAVAAINEAEANKADARALQEQQAAARGAYESYGQLSVMSGGVLVGLGLTAAVAGGVLVATQQGSPE